MRSKVKTQANGRFLKLVKPVLAEFGFADEKELIREQIVLMLEARISQYEAEKRMFEDKYKGRYEKVSKKCFRVEKFDFEDDLNDWRFALEAIEANNRKLGEILNA
ncbi:MAG: hypothetical protein WAW22_12995 [Smithellaceae bacterium]